MKARIEIKDGIITGDSKRLLEQYNLGLSFKQRKNYDEYYNETVSSCDVDLETLSLISQFFKIEVSGDVIYLTDLF